jgi:hypothetical protein
MLRTNISTEPLVSTGQNILHVLSHVFFIRLFGPSTVTLDTVTSADGPTSEQRRTAIRELMLNKEQSTAFTLQLFTAATFVLPSHHLEARAKVEVVQSTWTFASSRRLVAPLVLRVRDSRIRLIKRPIYFHPNAGRADLGT